MNSATPTITALQADPRDPNRVHVHIDGRHALAVSLDVAAAERLTVGQPCPPERLARLHSAQETQELFASALNFLSYRPRSAREVEMRLRRKGHTPEQIEAVMQRLKRLGLVDDLEFARFWVTNRMTFSPRGPRLLKSELRQKGVAPDVVEQVLQEREESAEAEAQAAAELAAESGELESADEDEIAPGSDLAHALALAKKRMRSLSGLDPLVARRRLSAFLARRGYNYDTIDKATKRVLLRQDEEESEDVE